MNNINVSFHLVCSYSSDTNIFKLRNDIITNRKILPKQILWDDYLFPTIFNDLCAKIGYIKSIFITPKITEMYNVKAIFLHFGTNHFFVLWDNINSIELSSVLFEILCTSRIRKILSLNFTYGKQQYFYFEFIYFFFLYRLI